MGKLTLMLVLAAAFGGALLTYSTRQLTGEAANDRRGAQAGVLARDLAQSVRAIVSGQMRGADGFVALNQLGLPTRSFGGSTIASVEYAGGVADVQYVPSTDRQTVDVTVTAFQEGASHRVRARYAYDNVDFPTPLWLDVPYATTSAATGSAVTGGSEARPAYFDRSKFDALQLGSIGLSATTMQTGMQSTLRGISGGTSMQLVTNTQLARLPGMEDINVTNAEGLYFAAIDAINATQGDVTLGAATTLTGNQAYGTARAPVIVRAPGGLTIASGGRLTGTGALVIEGAFTNAGTLDWDGLVIVHSEEDYLPIRFTGTARIDGALIVDQQGAPPGGHMDVSVWRAPTGVWSPAWGDLTGSPFCGSRPGTRCPLYQHTHKFELTPESAPRGKTIYFLDRDQTETQLHQALAALGNRRVRLELVNGSTYSGMARYHMDVNGTVTDGSVRLGFAQGDAFETQSEAFPADQLRHFDVAVRSLRMLRPLWDGVGSCDTMWPLCVGENRGRHSALTVRVVDAATNAVYYESSVYWHMQLAEVEQHNAEESAWRDQIESGAAFGTRLELGSRTTLNYDITNIRVVGPRLGFDPPEQDVLTTSTQHWEPAQPGSPAMSHLPAAGMVTLCHGGTQTMVTNVATATAHVRHGDPLSSCAVNASSGSTSPLTVCHSGTTKVALNAADYANHLRHGDAAGACAAGSGSGRSGSNSGPGSTGSSSGTGSGGINIGVTVGGTTVGATAGSGGVGVTVR